jgi:hypothetical protein
MSYRYNALTGNLDIVGAGSGGGSGIPLRTTATFNATTDWTLNGANYEIVILAASHGVGASPTVDVFENVSGDYQNIGLDVVVDASGNITLKVTSSPDNRFVGKYIIL